MKVTVKVDNQLFEVEIESVYARPIVAVVDGQRFEVWPEVGTAAAVPASTKPAAAAHTSTPPVPARVAASTADKDASAVYAPIPGVIVSVAVQPGDTVAAGGELCVLEAMKMKNTIRAPRAGQIAAVRVAAGQHVKHHDVLVEYAE